MNIFPGVPCGRNPKPLEPHTCSAGLHKTGHTGEVQGLAVSAALKPRCSADRYPPSLQFLSCSNYKKTISLNFNFFRSVATVRCDKVFFCFDFVLSWCFFSSYSCRLIWYLSENIHVYFRINKSLLTVVFFRWSDGLYML